MTKGKNFVLPYWSGYVKILYNFCYDFILLLLQQRCFRQQISGLLG
jgi:hypothetical protein